MAIAQPILWVLWKIVPVSPGGDMLKLGVFVAVLAVVGYLSRLGVLPRTRPILPGEWAID